MPLLLDPNAPIWSAKETTEVVRSEFNFYLQMHTPGIITSEIAELKKIKIKNDSMLSVAETLWKILFGEGFGCPHYTPKNEQLNFSLIFGTMKTRQRKLKRKKKR